MPLINNDGFHLGTLCAIDTKPKQLTADQKNALTVLSQQTVAQLELRRHAARLTESMSQVYDAKRMLREQVRRAEEAREEAIRARIEAEQANAAKSEFLSVYSSNATADLCIEFIHRLLPNFTFLFFFSFSAPYRTCPTRSARL